MILRSSPRSIYFPISGIVVDLPLKCSFGYSLRVFVYTVTLVVSVRILSYKGLKWVFRGLFRPRDLFRIFDNQNNINL